MYLMYHRPLTVNLVDNTYQLMKPNERGHYPIAPMGVELGIRQGFYQNAKLPYLGCAGGMHKEIYC